jgi:hypothetical protein
MPAHRPVVQHRRRRPPPGRGVGTHENPFRWSRGGLINTSSVPGPRRRARHLFGLWLDSPTNVAGPSAPVRTARRRPVPGGASGVRTIARKSHRSGLNSSPTPGREGVRFGAVSARFEPFRAVLVRFGPKSHGRNDRFGSESTPCDLDYHPRVGNTCLAKQVLPDLRNYPALRGVPCSRFVACEPHPRRPAWGDCPHVQHGRLQALHARRRGVRVGCVRQDQTEPQRWAVRRIGLSVPVADWRQRSWKLARCCRTSRRGKRGRDRLLVPPRRCRRGCCRIVVVVVIPVVAPLPDVA